MNNCFDCGAEVSEKARFCSACATQIRCKNCGEELRKDAIVCEMCGEEPMRRQAQGQAINHIRYKDGRKLIDLDASFTNEFGGSAATVFAMIRGTQLPAAPSIRQQKGIANKNDETNTKAEEIGEEENEGVVIQLPLVKSSNLGSSELLGSLFEQQADDSWILVNPVLKAKNKADFVKRATCLFLQYQHDFGNKPVPREDILGLLKNCGVYDSNVRAWFSSEKSLVRATAKDLTLILPGTQLVTEILQEMTNDEIPNTWKVGTVQKGGRKHSSKKSREKQDVESEENS